MLTADTTDFEQAVQELQREGKLPESLSTRQVQLLQRSFSRYAGQVGQTLLDDLLSDFQGKIQEALKGDQSTLKSNAIYNLGEYAGDEAIADRLKWGLEVAQQVVAGAGRYLNQNISPEAIDEYPALALVRMFQRDVPRGWKQKGKTLVPVPDDNWPSRWAEAGESGGGTTEAGPDWLPWSGDSQHGQGVALKQSGIWAALGSLRDDTLGNSYPPFAFNSGFSTKEKSRAEATALGLLKPGQKVQGAKINLESLFAAID